MKIYAQEKLDGLQELIEGSHTIAYCAPISTSNVALEITDEDRAIALSNMGTQAENEKQFDLYYLSSVLVSSGWNKNDDVFDPHEMWEARSTPEDKQFNFMHDEKDIIGHITENYVP